MKDDFACKLTDAALTIVVRACRKEVITASQEVLNAATAAMRAKIPEILDRLMENVREAPWIAEQSFRLAALELAEAGIAVLRGQDQQAKEVAFVDEESRDENLPRPVG